MFSRLTKVTTLSALALMCHAFQSYGMEGEESKGHLRASASKDSKGKESVQASSSITNPPVHSRAKPKKSHVKTVLPEKKITTDTSSSCRSAEPSVTEPQTNAEREAFIRMTSAENFEAFFGLFQQLNEPIREKLRSNLVPFFEMYFQQFQILPKEVKEENIHLWTAVWEKLSRLEKIMTYVAMDNLSAEEVKEKQKTILEIIQKGGKGVNLDFDDWRDIDPFIKTYVAHIVTDIALNNHQPTANLFSTFPHLSSIRSGVCLWENQKARDFSRALSGNSTVRHLDLSSVYLNDVTATYLFEGLSANRSVEVLNLSGNKMSNVSARGLTSLLEANRTLKSLSLSATTKSPENTKLLASSLMLNTTLEKLDMSLNGMKDPAARFFLDLLKSNNHIKEIDLSHNQMSPKLQAEFETVCGDKGIKLILKKSLFDVQDDGQTW